MQDRYTSLETEVQDLREEVRALRSEVQGLRRLVHYLAEQQDFVDSAADFTVVTDGGNTGQAGTSSGNNNNQRDSTAVDFRIGSARREAVIRRVGRFLADGLAGRHTGGSGRDEIPLRSQLWIVVRGREGQVFDPPRVFRRWALAKDLVKLGNDLGDSVFVGLPSENEWRVSA